MPDQDAALAGQSLEDEVTRLKEEITKQQNTIAALLGTTNMQVVTDDVVVLYHMQLSNSQSLQLRLEAAQQQLSNVVV